MNKIYPDPSFAVTEDIKIAFHAIAFDMDLENQGDVFDENEIILTSLELEYEKGSQARFFELKRQFLEAQIQKAQMQNNDNEHTRSSIGR